MEKIIETIANELGVKNTQVENAVKLIDEGNTIPFIARYRKEVEEIKNSEADLIVLDCIGYTQEMKKMFAEKTGKKVVLPRTLLARVVSELTDI